MASIAGVKTNARKRQLEEQIKARKRKVVLESKEVLIEAVKSYPCIWDKRIPAHNDRCQVEDAWLEVALQSKLDVDTCRKTWKNLLDHFRNIYNQTRGDGKSGSDVQDQDSQGPTKPVKWVFFKSLLFLSDVIAKRDDTAFTNGSEDFILKLQDDTLTSGAGAYQTVDSVASNGCSSDESQASIALRSSAKNMSGKKIEKRFEEQLLEHLQDMKNKQDTAAKFTSYLADLLRTVDPSVRRRCEIELLTVVTNYQDMQFTYENAQT